MPHTPQRPRNRLSRWNQPEPCRMCGKLTTWSEVNGHCGLGLCQGCFDKATTENAHLDGYHAADADGPDPDCPLCKETKQ